MIKYTTHKTIGITEKDAEKSMTAQEYIYRRRNGLLHSETAEKEFINVLSVIVESGLENRDGMKNLIDYIYPEMIESMGDAKKMGLSIRVGKDILKVVVRRDEDFEVIKRAIMRQYVAEIETPNIINKKSRKNNPSTM